MAVPHGAIRFRLIVALVVGAVALGSWARADEAPARLGTVSFEVACDDAARVEFDRAMALYHSFAWAAAAEAFDAVAAADPSCGMAHWGRAMTMLGNPFIWPTGLAAEKLDAVAVALDAARTAGLGGEREQGYVAALAAFVRDHASVGHGQRMQAYDDAMAALAARHADDVEAAILSALVTSANFDPADKGYTNQLAAAAILEPIFETLPDHPGIAHYLIHSYDYPPIAAHGLGAARAYAAIAPDAPHAQHMPSHIFTRLGLWRDSISANRTSARIAGGATFDGHHASDYMVYAHLQLAQDAAAGDAMAASLAMTPIDGFAAAFAYAAMPARLALERGDWAAAATLPLRPEADAYPWSKYPHAEAINALARGIGAALTGNAAAARDQETRLIALRDATQALKLAYWVEQVDIQAAIVGALALCAEGAAAPCLDALAEAAMREDATEKHAVTPGPLVPARELLADALMNLGRPAEALAQYEAVLAKEPNRFRALAGAMTAAQASGDAAKAKALAIALVTQAAEADGARAALDEAKALAGG